LKLHQPADRPSRRSCEAPATQLGDRRFIAVQAAFGFAACLLAAFIVSRAVSASSDLWSLQRPPWPALVVLGGLAGVAGRTQWPLAAGGCLTVALLVAVTRLSREGTFWAMADAFALATAAMAGLHAGRAAMLALVRRNP